MSWSVSGRVMWVPQQSGLHRGDFTALGQARRLHHCNLFEQLAVNALYCQRTVDQARRGSWSQGSRPICQSIEALGKTVAGGTVLRASKATYFRTRPTPCLKKRFEASRSTRCPLRSLPERVHGWQAAGSRLRLRGQQGDRQLRPRERQFSVKDDNAEQYDNEVTRRMT